MYCSSHGIALYDTQVWNMAFFKLKLSLFFLVLYVVQGKASCDCDGILSLSHSSSIYIYEIGSSYTWCNSTRVTPFLNRRFMRDPTDKNKTLLSITTLNSYLINSLLIFSLLIIYFLCLFFSLLIKSLIPFSLQFLLRFYFLRFFPLTKLQGIESLINPVKLISTDFTNLCPCLTIFLIPTL